MVLVGSSKVRIVHCLLLMSEIIIDKTCQMARI